MMTGLLYFLAFLVAIHNAIYLWDAAHKPLRSWDWLSLLLEGIMLGLALTAGILGNWEVLMWGFGAYRFLVGLQIAWRDRSHGRFSMLLVVNMLTSVICLLLAYFDQGPWFAVCYPVFWVSSFYVARKAIPRKIPVS
ncbi:MAG: hypothetical protein AAF804_21685 [Bacteroidota bacterium]